MVFYNLRWVPLYRYFKELMDGGYVGRPFDCHLHRRIGHLKWDYHWLHDRDRSLGAMPTSMIDFALWYFGDIKKVSTSLATFNPIPSPNGQSYEPANDSAVLAVQYSNGAHGTICRSMVVHLGNHQQSITVNGEKGRLESFLNTEAVLDWRGEIRGAQTHENEVKKLEIPERFWEGVDQTKSGLDLLVESLTKQSVGDRLFVDAILNGTPVSPNFFDCLKVQRVVDAAFRAHESGKWVTL